MIEIANLLVICASSDTLGIVQNFVAIVIVTEFDNFVYESMREESFRQLL